MLAQEPALLAHDGPPTSGRLITASEIRFSEIISAFSVALDITQGHPQGHCMRTALIGMRLAEELKLPAADGAALFYALLLKDLGCSSNAAKVTHLFGADDHRVKRSARLTDWTKAGQSLKCCWNNCAPRGGTLDKLKKFVAVARHGKAGAVKLAEIRCQRGAEIARLLKLPDATAQAILDLEEHWDGRGMPRGLKGEQISLLARIASLTQTVEVFFQEHGLTAALDIARERRGTWFDPQLVDCLLACKGDAAFWRGLENGHLLEEVARIEPEDTVLIADEACLDRVAEAFARVVDAKSPWTYEHSTRVADFTVGIAQQFGCSDELKRDMRRAALLHDIGKLGVSNAILDKPGRPTEEEYEQIRKHPEYSQRILAQVEAFAALAEVAGGHHERLDGKGYHRGLNATQIPWVTRVLTVADVCEAMSARRPYREALEWEQIQKILMRDAGRGVDLECLRAIGRWHDRHAFESRVEAQLREVDRVLAEW
jgi:HD-GYP domain-containing protein (c-di-GMP phosphodiesterase class II)